MTYPKLRLFMLTPSIYFCCASSHTWKQHLFTSNLPLQLVRRISSQTSRETNLPVKLRFIYMVFDERLIMTFDIPLHRLFWLCTFYRNVDSCQCWNKLKSWMITSKNFLTLSYIKNMSTFIIFVINNKHILILVRKM